MHLCIHACVQGVHTCAIPTQLILTHRVHTRISSVGTSIYNTTNTDPSCAYTGIKKTNANIHSVSFNRRVPYPLRFSRVHTSACVCAYTHACTHGRPHSSGPLPAAFRHRSPPPPSPSTPHTSSASTGSQHNATSPLFFPVSFFAIRPSPVELRPQARMCAFSLRTIEDA